MNPHFKQALDEGLIEPALIKEQPFEVDGVKFYQFAQGGTTMSAGRFYAMADMNRDHDELKLDGLTLDSAISVIDDVLTTIVSETDKDAINAAVMTAKLHVVNLRQRRKYDLSIERTYDNATAWYFAEDENPLVYDAAKAQRNKLLWMKQPESLDFFGATNGQVRQLANAVQLRRPELFEKTTHDGVVDFGIQPRRYKADRTDERYKYHFEIAGGDPQRITYLLNQPLEAYLAYIGTWYSDQKERAERAKKEAEEMSRKNTR